MKPTNFLRILCLILAMLLLWGCTPKQETPSTETTTQPESDVTEPPEDPELTRRRELVLEKMRQMQSIIWTPAEDITYTRKNASAGVDQDDAKYVLTLKAGELYRGIPYTHGSGSEEAFLDYVVSQDENGVYTISGLGTEDLSGDDGRSPMYRPRIGNDCADALFWSWAQVATSISFKKTTYMTPAYGCMIVGGLDYNFEAHQDTKAYCQEQGLETLCGAYAQLKPGDGVVHAPDGHAMMVEEVHLAYTKDGAISPMNSYITAVHQTSYTGQSYYDTELRRTVNCCGFSVSDYYFYELFNNGYLPITCKELVDSTPLAEGYAAMSNPNPTAETMFEGMVTSNYRISDVTITVSDENGQQVQTCTCYGREAEMYEFILARFIEESEQPGLRGALDLDALASGAYTVTYTCRIATGDTLTVGSFPFEK